MSDNHSKSKEEIALDLLKIIVSCKTQSGDNQRTVQNIIDIHTNSIEDKCNWYLNLYQNCLKKVKDKEN